LIQVLLPILVVLSAHEATLDGTAPAVLCEPELPTLGYPISALQERVMGEVQVDFNIDLKGVAQILGSTGYPSLAVEADSAVRNGRYPAACRGRKLSIQVQFRLDPNLEPGTPIRTSQMDPLRFEVVAPAEVVVIVISDPPLDFKKTLRNRLRTLVRKLQFWGS
jgi:hypothetical protein